MKKQHLVFSVAMVATFLLAGFSSASGATTASVYSQTFTRGKGKPTLVTTGFSVLPSLSGPFTMTASDFEHNAITILLNGAQVFGPGDFQGLAVSKTVVLGGTNTLAVQMAGKPGSIVTVTVTGHAQYPHAADYAAIPLMPSSSVSPKPFDWRLLGAVTPVQNDGGHATDWTFSATGAVEGAYYIANGVTNSFAVQPLIDCGGWGTDGSPALGLTYMQDAGITYQAHYPYTGIVGQCRSYTPIDSGPASITRVPPGDEATLVHAVLLAPVSVVVQGGAWFSTYQGGVVDPSTCDPTDYHAMLLVGISAQGHWILKGFNGTAWGDAGYLYLPIGVNACGIADYAVFAKY